MKVKWDDLEDAFMGASFGAEGEIEAYIDRETGAILIRSGLDEEDEELPPDLDENPRYIALPDKHDLDLGANLAIAFADEHLPDDADEVRLTFRNRGAYARFKAILQRRGALQRWYDFQNAAEEAALREWCAANGIEIER